MRQTWVPAPRTIPKDGVVEIDIDPLRFTAPARSEITPDEAAAAVALNAANPIVPGARAPALPFFFDPALPAVERARAEHCLTLAIYYEAAIEAPVGQRAVAQVVLNRVRHPLYPQTVCGVVFQGSSRTTGCQFSFTCDGSMRRTPSASGWRRAASIASAALSGHVEESVGTATHYHTDWVAPIWRTELVKLAQLGTHIFYRWPGRMGLPAAFGMRYRGGEILDMAAPGLEPQSDLSTAPPDPSAPPVSEPVVDGPSALRPAPLTADADRGDLRADENRGELAVENRAGALRP